MHLHSAAECTEPWDTQGYARDSTDFQSTSDSRSVLSILSPLEEGADPQGLHQPRGAAGFGHLPARHRHRDPIRGNRGREVDQEPRRAPAPERSCGRFRNQISRQEFGTPEKW